MYRKIRRVKFDSGKNAYTRRRQSLYMTQRADGIRYIHRKGGTLFGWKSRKSR